MGAKNKPLGKKILRDVEEVIGNFDRSTKDIATWKQFLKLQLIREILVTRKQK